MVEGAGLDARDPGSRPFSRRVAVIGGSQCDDETAETARQAGRLIAGRGWLLVCGGRGGVMRAACQGAREAGGATVGLLPGEDWRAGNEFLSLAIATGLGHMRNFLVVLNADAVLAVSGGAGTLSEIALALKIGRPVAAVGQWAGLPGVRRAQSAEEAMNLLETLLTGSGDEHE